jgi:ADP-heptose:LPS heptosyltransferase
MSERALLVAAGGGIGDTLLAGVVARALRARYAAVDAVVLPEHVDLAAHIPEIERVIPFGERLRERYAAAIVTWATLGTAMLPWRARIPIRVGQARRLYSPLFTERVVVRSELGDRTSAWTDVLLDYARAIGLPASDPVPAFRITDEERRDARALLGVHDATNGYYVLHPTRGISGQRARWPTSGLAALARSLTARDGLPVLVSGAPDDAVIAQTIADDAGRGVFSIAGATTIGTFAAVAADARVVYAMDSGPMHVAAAVGAPTVGIFALQSDEPDRWAPRGRLTAVVRPTYPCPASHRKETCPDFPCVRDLDVRGILAAGDGLLATPAER